MTTPLPEPLDLPALADDGTWAITSGGDAPCRTWPVLPDCSCLPDDVADYTSEHRYAVELATTVLWRLTARQYGVCRDLVRPCQSQCVPVDTEPFRWSPLVGPGAGMRPVLIDGTWLNIGCGCMPARRKGDGCSCGTGPDRIRLPGPVVWDRPDRVADPSAPRYELLVWDDGVLLDEAADYYLYPSGDLFRAGGGEWPYCQDLGAAYDAEGAFSVLYWRGSRVPIDARRAVSVLACQLYKKCVGDGSCELPQRVTELTREGITYTFVDPLEFQTKGRTGLAEVDMWLAAVNPLGLRQQSTVWSPDTRRRDRLEGRDGGAAPWLPPYPAP